MKNKKKDPFFFVLKTITDIVYYLSAFMALFLIVSIITLSFFSEFFQDKISLPVHLNVSGASMTELQVEPILNTGAENITVFQITYLTKNLTLIRILLLYYFIITAGILVALFFGKKILSSYQRSTFFSQENRTLVNYLGYLLLAYIPLYYLINLFFESWIDLKTAKISVSPSLSQGFDIGIMLVVWGSILLFIGKTVKKGISA
jgi:hypothetical protein